MLIFTAVMFVFVGAALLILGSELVVSRAQTLARRLAISELIIGLTVVTFGSNLPEISTAIRVGLSERAGVDASGLLIGNIIGTSLVNVTLIIGICAIITTLKIDRATYQRESLAMGAALLIMLFVTLDGQVGWLEGAGLCLAYLTYLLVLGRVMSRLVATDHLPERVKRVLHVLHLRPIHEEDVLEEHLHHPPVVKHSLRLIVLDVVLLFIGLALVMVGAEQIVKNGLELATRLGMHTVVIGVLLGLFTSLPEMAIAVRALRSGADGLVLGNLMGGNILNPLFTLGIAALIAPIGIDSKVLFFEMPFLIFGTLLTLTLLRDRNDLDRLEGTALLSFYGLFLFMSLFTFA